MPNAEAIAATAAAATKRSETRTSPLPRQAPRRPAIGFRGCMVRATLSLLAAGATGFDRLNEPSQYPVRFSLTKRAPYDAASYWGACLSPRDKLRSRLAAAQHRFAIYLRHCKAKRACRQ